MPINIYAPLNFFTISGLALLVLAVALACFNRKNILQLLLWMTIADLAYAIIGMTMGITAGEIGASLQTIYTGTARILAFICLFKLKQQVGSVNINALAGVGRQFPATTAIFALAMFAALDISPFFTPDAKPYILYAALEGKLWLASIVMVAANAVLAVLTVLAVHKIWLEGTSKTQTENIFKLTLPLILATAIAFMGIFGHQFTAFIADFTAKDLQTLPDFTLSWHKATLIIFIAAPLSFIVGKACKLANLRNIITGLSMAAALTFLFIDPNIKPLAKLFGVIVTGIGLMVTVYSWSYIEKARSDAYYFFLMLMFASLTGIATSSNFGSFFVFWEIMTLSSYVLVAFEATDKAHYAAKKYFIMCSVAAAIMLPGLLLFQVQAGSLDIEILSASNTFSPIVASVIAILVLVGCGVKAGLVPGHGWLPDAHPAAPSSISAPLSGVLTKAGIFGIVQVFLVVLGFTALSGDNNAGNIPTLGLVLSTLGALTMIYGEIMALRQEDLKRLLAYSTMGQIGEITMTLGLCTWLATAGSLMHVLNHAVMKDLLFLCTGALILRAGSKNLADLKGLGKAMPFTATCMVVGLISILGLPPLAGFTSKYMMLYSLAEVNPLLAALMLLASMAGVVYYTRIIRTLIFEPYEGPAIEEAPLSMRLPLAILTALCIILGVFPQIGLSLVLPVVDSLASAGKLSAQSLPLLVASWPSYTVLLMLGAFVPMLLRKNKKLAGQSAALILVAASILAIVTGYKLDTLSYIFVLIITVLGSANMFYSVGYMNHSHTQWRFYAFFLFMIAGLTGVASSQTLFSFFLFWEIMSSWSLYFVIVHEENPVALKEGFKYFFFNVLGAAFLFLGVILINGWLGTTEFNALKAGIPQLESWKIILFFALMAIGFVMKAAQLPFRIDIQMHPASAPTPVSGYISSVLLKSAIFGLAKLFLVFGGTSVLTQSFAFIGVTNIMDVVVWVGGITIVMAAAYAVFQHDLKLVLIYSTVSQLGYMVVGVALGTSLGVAGGLLHLINHAFFKDLLFLVVGAIIVQAHQQSMNKISGLGKQMPITLGFFAIGAACVIGIPPSSGFTSKWIIYHALMEQGFVVVALLSLVGSVITLVYFAKMMHSAFLGHPSAETALVKEAPKSMLIPMGFLALGCIITSIFPGVLLYPLNAVLTDFNLATLDIAPWGINSGAGAWNASLTAILLIVAWFIGKALLSKMSGKERLSDVHTCGIPLEELNLNTTTRDIYSKPSIQPQLVKDSLAKNQ